MIKQYGIFNKKYWTYELIFHNFIHEVQLIENISINIKMEIMRKLLITAIIFIAVLSSCELIKDATEVDFNADYGLSFNIGLGAGDTQINETDTIDLTGDSEFETYSDKLEEVILDSVLLTIPEYNGPETCYLTGTVEYSSVDQTNGKILASVSGVNIQNLYTTATAFKITIDKSQISGITDIMLNDKQIKVTLNGNASNVPVEFKCILRFYITVVAQPLD